MRLRLLGWPAGLALGAYTVAVARDNPASSFAQSLGGALVLLTAGFALLACGLVGWGRRPGSAVGPLLAVAGCAWFLSEWDSPGVGSGAVFTIGLVLGVACPPLVAWAMLGYPNGRLAWWGERASVGVALVGALVVLGIMPALFFDPAAAGCGRCPSNRLLVKDEPGLVDGVDRVGMHLGLAWSLLLIVVAGAALARSSRARTRVVAPVVVAGCAYLGFVAASFATGLDRGFVGSGTLEHRLWLGQAISLGALALVVAWGWLSVRRTRTSVARLVVELGEPATGGSLRDALASALADPELELAYPVGADGFADALGRPVDLAALDGRTATPLVRDGRRVAILVHQASLHDNPDLVEGVVSACRLALEHERLRAETQSQLEDIRASRVRIIESGDAERRRLERDLHDGAQQRLVGLSLALRLLRTQFDGDTSPGLSEQLDRVEAELQSAIAALRDLAHGIHPAVLTDEGLAAAVEGLAEGGVPLRIGVLPDERFAPAVETAAYHVVAESAKAGGALVDIATSEGALVVDVEADAAPEALVDLNDRVGALNGRISVERTLAGAVRIRAEIPCG